MRLERIEKLGVEMIEILPQVVQRNISNRPFATIHAILGRRVLLLLS